VEAPWLAHFAFKRTPRQKANAAPDLLTGGVGTYGVRSATQLHPRWFDSKVDKVVSSILIEIKLDHLAISHPAGDRDRARDRSGC
jgi:hypothetical protein